MQRGQESGDGEGCGGVGADGSDLAGGGVVEGLEDEFLLGLPLPGALQIEPEALGLLLAALSSPSEVQGDDGDEDEEQCGAEEEADDGGHSSVAVVGPGLNGNSFLAEEDVALRCLAVAPSPAVSAGAVVSTCTSGVEETTPAVLTDATQRRTASTLAKLRRVVCISKQPLL